MADRSKDFQKAFQSALRELNRRGNMQGYADKAADLIRTRTRLGFGVDQNGANRQKLPALKPSTVASRRRKRRKGTLSKKTTPKKSNLTDTEQLLNSLKGKVSGVAEITVEPSGSRKETPTTNNQVADFVQKKGFVFLNFGRNEIRQLSLAIRDDLIPLIEKHLRRIRSPLG